MPPKETAMRNHILIGLLAMLTLTGCSLLSSIMPTIIPPAPQTLAQQIIAADEAAAALINTAAALEAKGVIAPNSTVETVVNATIITVQQALDKASDDVATGQSSEAQTLLTAAMGAISGLQTALNGATSPTTAITQ